MAFFNQANQYFTDTCGGNQAGLAVWELFINLLEGYGNDSRCKVPRESSS